MKTNDPWVIKYAPQNIEEMVLSKELKQLFKNNIQNNQLSNITLYGIPGIGKSTLAKILTKELGCENILFQSCSIDGSIDMVKTKIKDFCDIIAKPNQYKIIILDEADSLTSSAGTNAGAQMALRNIIAEAMDDTRFILTCNYIDRIIPALQSRCTPIKIDFSIKEVVLFIVNILNKEGIKYNRESLDIFVKQTIKRRFPDIRSIIEHLQLACQTGTLENLQSTNDIIDDEILDFINKCNDPKQIREFLIHNEEKFSSDYILLAGKLFDYYINYSDVALCIADYIYKMTIVLDKEIQFSSMIIQIKRMLNT